MHQTPTSNARTDGVLGRLRSLMPQRRLTAHEAFQIAEHQASAFRELLGLRDDAIDLEHLATLPRIRLVAEHDLPVSGAAHWGGGAWIVTLNADEPATRQRYSAFHEFKHVLDHPTVHLGY